MRRFYFLNLLMALFVLAAANASAQAISYLGPRLYVNSPSGISGYKTFTYSSTSSGNSPWGRVLDSVWNMVDLVKSVDSLGCNQPGSASYTNKWVLIWRGTCQFGEKAKGAQDKGAKGVIIINNVPGADPILMAAGTAGGAVTIPVLMVSNTDGIALWNTLGNNPVKISLTTWGFGYTNDLAFVPKSAALTTGAVPFSQMSGSTANAFKGYTGALVANVGTSDQTNVKIKSVVTFTPTGGSSSVVYTDSAVVNNFTTIDSLISITSPNTATFTPTSTGMYTTTYTLSADNADDNISDNTISFNTYVTNNMYCKARTDAAGNPTVTQGLRFGTGSAPFIWGPLFYVNKGGYKAQSLRYAISDGDTTKKSLADITVADKSSVAYLFKWTDGSNGGTTDGIIQGNEIVMKGAAIKTFTTADSNNKVFTSFIGDVNGNPATIQLDANSWYWIVVDMPGATFLGCDEQINYYTRTFAAKYATTSVTDWWAPVAVTDMASFTGGTDAARMIPAGTTPTASSVIDSAFFPNTDAVPAIALELSPSPISVNEIANEGTSFSVFPNPATTSINIKLNLARKAETIQVRIVDAVGRRVTIDEYKNLQTETLNVSTEKLSAGNYYVVLVANGYASVQPFVVTKQ